MHSCMADLSSIFKVMFLWLLMLLMWYNMTILKRFIKNLFINKCLTHAKIYDLILEVE
jgi:hypothetical protein